MSEIEYHLGKGSKVKIEDINKRVQIKTHLCTLFSYNDMYIELIDYNVYVDKKGNVGQESVYSNRMKSWLFHEIKPIS